MTIDNWQTWKSYSKKHFWEYMNICMTNHSLVQSEIVWLNQWRIFETRWEFESEEEFKTMRLGHYMGWINRSRVTL
jgi:hypothetical protein